jgi:hypothetical protein
MTIESKRRATYMAERHCILPEEAGEAARDVDALWLDPTPRVEAVTAVRVIGYSHTANSVLAVILVRMESGFGWCGANGWRSNSTERRIYEEGE